MDTTPYPLFHSWWAKLKHFKIDAPPTTWANVMDNMYHLLTCNHVNTFVKEFIGVLFLVRFAEFKIEPSHTRNVTYQKQQTSEGKPTSKTTNGRSHLSVVCSLVKTCKRDTSPSYCVWLLRTLFGVGLTVVFRTCKAMLTTSRRMPCQHFV